MKKILFLSILIFLSGCGSSNKTELQSVKLGNISFNINKQFVLTDIKNNDRKIEIISSYKLENNKGFSPSIIIGKYKGEYPKDKDKFINIIANKLQKNIAGSKIINIDTFKKGDITLKSIEYIVNNNIFDEKKGTNYYGIQYYVFTKDKVYLISYISSNKDNLNNFIKNIKDLQLIK